MNLPMISRMTQRMQRNSLTSAKGLGTSTSACLMNRGDLVGFYELTFEHGKVEIGIGMKS